LERDQAAVLTLRSAAKGVVDYTRLDLHDPAWWRYWRFSLQAMHSLERGELLRMVFEQQLALVSNPKLSGEQFSERQKEASELFQDIEGNLYPWKGRSREERQAHEEKEFAQQWEELTGFDPSDDEAKEQWAEDIRRLTREKVQQRQQAAQEEQDRQANFHAKVAAIRQKRIRQQGRR